MNIIWESISGVANSYGDSEFLEKVQAFQEILKCGTPIGFMSDIVPWITKLAPKLTKYDFIEKQVIIFKKYINVSITYFVYL